MCLFSFFLNRPWLVILCGCLSYTHLGTYHILLCNFALQCTFKPTYIKATGYFTCMDMTSCCVCFRSLLGVEEVLLEYGCPLMAQHQLICSAGEHLCVWDLSSPFTQREPCDIHALRCEIPVLPWQGLRCCSDGKKQTALVSCSGCLLGTTAALERWRVDDALLRKTTSCRVTWRMLLQHCTTLAQSFRGTRYMKP